MGDSMTDQSIRLQPLPGRRSQLVYWQSLPVKQKSRWDGAHSEYIACIPSSFSVIRSVFLSFGLVGAFVTLLKLCTPSRGLGVVFSDKQIVSFAWVKIGRCRHYKVRESDAVIGPVCTLLEFRGRGLAVKVVRKCLEYLSSSGYSGCFLDTSSKNYAMQRVAAKTGFGIPVALLPRPELLEDVTDVRAQEVVEQNNEIGLLQ